MKLAMQTWARAPRRRGGVDLLEARKNLVRQLAPGKSFIDVGGMFGIHGAMAFEAEEAGAREVLLFDGMDPSEEFEAEHLRRGSSVRYVQGDLHDPVGTAEAGAFDVVWCTGVIYHSPNPYWLIEQLRRMTLEHLLLGSVVMPEIPGFENACIFTPGMSEAAQSAFAAGLGVGAAGKVGMTSCFDRTPTMGYSNCWWAISPSALRAMLDAANFEVTKEVGSSPFHLDVLAAPVARESTIPPLGFSRKRGQDRLAGMEHQPTWA